MATAHPSVYSTKLKLIDTLPSLVVTGNKFLKWTEVSFLIIFKLNFTSKNICLFIFKKGCFKRKDQF